MGQVISSVLCYIKKDNQFLMLYRNKKENDINEGKWIGVGGKIEKRETIEQALIRECKEETNLDIISYKKYGIVHFYDDDYEEIMHLFVSNAFEGELTSNCNEGTLKWINIDEVLSLPLWEGDKYFLNKIINNQLFNEIKLIYTNHVLTDIKIN